MFLLPPICLRLGRLGGTWPWPWPAVGEEARDEDAVVEVDGKVLPPPLLLPRLPLLPVLLLRVLPLAAAAAAAAAAAGVVGGAAALGVAAPPPPPPTTGVPVAEEALPIRLPVGKDGGVGGCVTGLTGTGGPAAAAAAAAAGASADCKLSIIRSNNSSTLFCKA